jgi:CubicO group peptidase (beta-lactamase class C family)
MKEKLDVIMSAVIKKKHIYGAVFYVSNDNKSIDLINASGNIEENSQYYIASINKFFVSAIILKLFMEKKLELHDKLSKYLSQEEICGLHIYKGKDYSNDISIIHLLSLTSGLPCYLIDKQVGGKKAMDDLECGLDQSWSIEKVIKEVKKMKPHFPPGKIGKAKYADTNHQILSLLIEKITGVPVNIVLKNLFQELNMTRTYVYNDEKKEDFIPILYKAKEVYLPLFLSSTKNDIISTAKDQMTFIKAFFNGYFFPKERLNELHKWNKIFFPFEYGIGIQKFNIPRFLSPFNRIPEMIGHCGSTGSVAFYVPEKRIYITGTTNQQAKPNIAFQTMIKIINNMN